MSANRLLFKDRKDAAERLKEQLPLDQMKQEKWHLVAVSPGGLELIISFLPASMRLKTKNASWPE